MEVETKTSPSLQPRKMICKDDRHALKRLFISANSASETFSSTNTFRSQSVVVLPYMYEKSSAHGPANEGASPFPFSATSPLPLSATSPLPLSATSPAVTDLPVTAQPTSNTRNGKTAPNRALKPNTSWLPLHVDRNKKQVVSRREWRGDIARATCGLRISSVGPVPRPRGTRAPVTACG